MADGALRLYSNTHTQIRMAQIGARDFLTFAYTIKVNFRQEGINELFKIL